MIPTFSAEANYLARNNIVMDATATAVAVAEAKARADIAEYLPGNDAPELSGGKITRNGEASPPQGGFGKAATAVAVTNVVTATAHGLRDGYELAFFGLTGGVPLVAGTTYYARDVSGATFKVAASRNGPLNRHH